MSEENKQGYLEGLKFVLDKMKQLIYKIDPEQYAEIHQFSGELISEIEAEIEKVK